MTVSDPDQRAQDIAAAELFFLSLGRGTGRQRARSLARAPWAAVQTAALHHPDPGARRWMLFLLDHYANDASMATFAEALHDPDAGVRGMALHSIACEPCKSEELCVADVVPSLIDTLHHDPSQRLRLTSLQELLQLAAHDDRVRPAIQHAADHDPDPLVRHSASEALQGRYVRPRKVYERSQRRHAQSRPRPPGPGRKGRH